MNLKTLSPPSADLRPHADPAAEAPERAPGRQGRALRQARGLQQRPGLRRQQDAQARVPDSRSARAGLRHAGVHRRHPVEPDAPGRRRGRAPGHEVRAGAGELGQLLRRRLRPRGQHRDVAHPGRRRAPGRRRLRHRHPPELGAGAWTTCARPAASRSRFRPAAPSIRCGGLGFVGFAEEVRAAGGRARLQVRLHRGLLGHRQHAGRHGGRLRGRRPRRPRDRHRRIGQARADPSADPAHRAATPPSWSSSAATITEKDVVLDTRYGGPEYGLPNEGTLEAIRLCARQEGMLTDPVYEGKSMHGMIDKVRRGEFPAGLEGALCAPGRRARAQRLQLPVPQRLSARSGVVQGRHPKMKAAYSRFHRAWQHPSSQPWRSVWIWTNVLQ